MGQTIQTLQVKSLTGDGKTVTINADEFDPELHERIEGKQGKARRQLLADAVQLGDDTGTLDAAAMKELGPKKTKQEKDALDNAKVVKEPGRTKAGGAAVEVGAGARVENVDHKPDAEADARRKAELRPGTSSVTSVVGDAAKQAELKGTEPPAPANPEAAKGEKLEVRHNTRDKDGDKK